MWADDIQSQIQAASTATVDAATALAEHIGLLLAGIVAVSAHARALIPLAAINPVVSKALDAAGGNYDNAKIILLIPLLNGCSEWRVYPEPISASLWPPNAQGVMITGECKIWK